jgi:hypothetical protein
VDANNPVNVVVAPDPVINPGLIVHVPEGSPLKTTLPVGTAHVGCVTAPIIGAGTIGISSITISADNKEVQPVAVSVTEKL